MQSVGAERRIVNPNGFVSFKTQQVIYQKDRTRTFAVNSRASGLNIKLAPCTTMRLAQEKTRRARNAPARFVELQFNGSRSECVGMGRLIVRPSEDMRYTLPEMSRVSRLEVRDGVRHPNKDVAEDVEEQIEVIMSRLSCGPVAEKWMWHPLICETLSFSLLGWGIDTPPRLNFA